MISNSRLKYITVGSREITHMQMGQCGSKEAHPEFFAAGAWRFAPSL
jgi:hypothetical protein